MKNMGPKSTQWLAAVGIHTLDDVAQLGVVETYKRVRTAYPEKVTLNLLWGLQAALLDLPEREQQGSGQNEQEALISRIYCEIAPSSR